MHIRCNKSSILYFADSAIENIAAIMKILTHNMRLRLQAVFAFIAEKLPDLDENVPFVKLAIVTLIDYSGVHLSKLQLKENLFTLHAVSN